VEKAIKEYLVQGTLAERVAKYRAVQKATQVVIGHVKSAVSEYITTQDKSLFEKRIDDLKPLVEELTVEGVCFEELKEIRKYTLDQAKRFFKLLEIEGALS
jgi:alkyl sulfatase BDS1-like metallo-beta-lactamase superfamily hydrolase